MKFTKHFYIEGQRIVSKLGELGEYQYLLNPKDTLAGGGTIDFDLKGKDLKDAIYANFEDLGLDGAVFTAGKSGKVPYGCLKKYYRNAGLINGGGSTHPDSTDTPSNKVENLQFYYHPDHLGSSSYITDISGEVYQHMEYFPFGETFIEERTDAEYTSYLYNGKELDEETGLYYYGARYYDPRISMWYGVDPLAEKYVSWSTYQYVRNNPILRIDPNGKSDDEFEFYASGKIKQIEKEGEDKVIIMNSNNERTGETVNIGEDAKLRNIKSSEGTTYQMLEINDQVKAKEAFITISDNSANTAEFGLINYNESNGSAKSSLVTQGEPNKVNAGGLAQTFYDKDGKSVTEINHNRPENTMPSGYDRQTGEVKTPLSGDAESATNYSKNSKGESIKWGVYRPVFKSLNRYDEKKVYHGEKY